MVVSPQNPFKKKKNLLSSYKRLRMVELGIGDVIHIQASGVEMHLPHPSYTIDTLTHLREKHPTYEFSLIMGADNLTHFHKWKNYEAILNHYRLYVYPRGDKHKDLPLLAHDHVTMFEAPMLDISATYIRETLKGGGSVRYMVPDGAHAYLESFGAYRDN